MIERKRAFKEVKGLLSRHRVLAILGARQVGKTTLARQIVSERRGPTTYFDLEDPTHLARLSEPMLALRELQGLVVIDEIQRKPDLFPVIRVLVDRQESRLRFLILGSAGPDLLQQSSETLAGRIFYYELGGFSLEETGIEQANRLWIRGGFPRSFLARSEKGSVEWRRAFIQTYLERDIPQLGLRIPSETLRRFWAMLAHYQGQVWNASEFARSFGVGDTTVRRYLDLLTTTFLIRQLRPWRENINKRQVKAPKIYFNDSGLLHTLLQLDTASDVQSHPKLGASWEGFVLNAVTSRLGVRPEECFFWATHAGAELDLLVVRGRTRLGFEFKRTETPSITRSMRTVSEDLGLRRLDVIHAGEQTFPLSKSIRAVAFSQIHDALKPLR
ncbi:ATP-binding protein [Thermodesulfobacteriota bacterium]